MTTPGTETAAPIPWLGTQRIPTFNTSYRNDAAGVQVPAFAILDNGPIQPDRYADDITFYAQDRMSTGRLTLNYGARYELLQRLAPCSVPESQCPLGGSLWRGVLPTSRPHAQVEGPVSENQCGFQIDRGRSHAAQGQLRSLPERDDPGDQRSRRTEWYLQNKYVWLGDLNGTACWMLRPNSGAGQHRAPEG